MYGFVYNIFHNMETVYHVALIYNSFLVALIPVFANKIAIHYFHFADRRAFLLSICVVFYPAYIIYSKYAMNEVMLLFIIWPILYLLFGFLEASKKKRMILGFLIGGLSIYAYIVHGRGLAILCISFFVFLILVLSSHNTLKEKIKYICSFILPCICLNLLNSIVKANIVNGFYGVEANQIANTTENFLSISFIKSLLDRDSIRLIYGVIGQSFYITVATLGLAVVAVVLFVKLFFEACKKKKADKWVIFGTFSIGLTIITIIMSVLFFANLYITESMQDSSYYFYGRYIELTGGMLIFAYSAPTGN